MEERPNIHESLEREISELSQDIERRKESSEGQNIEKRELLKQSIRSAAAKQADFTEDKKQEKKLSQKEEIDVFPEYIDEDELDDRVKFVIEKLLDKVFHESLFKALRESKKHSPFIQDVFHDALVDKLLPEMEKRKMI